MRRISVVLLASAGVMFLLYPVLRPYSDETGAAGAEAFASNTWVYAHVFAMLGFVAVAVGVRTLTSAAASTTILVGAGLVLPYYGAEAFALHAIGIRAVDQSDPSLLTLADPIRYSVIPATMFAVGLVLLAIGAIMTARSVAYTSVPRWLGVPFAAGFVLFLPQFFAAPGLRIAHGVLMLLGCVALAVVAARSDRADAKRRSDGPYLPA